MKSYIVLVRHGNIITRHSVAAVSSDVAANVAMNRFGGVILNVLAN